MTDEPKRVWPWIVALLIGLLVLYVASFGPASRMAKRKKIPDDVFEDIYRPLGWLAFYGPRPIAAPIWRWTMFCGGGEGVEDMDWRFFPPPSFD